MTSWTVQTYMRYAFPNNSSTDSKRDYDLDIGRLRAGDTAVIWKLGRLGDLRSFINQLAAKQVHGKRLHEHIDTSTPIGTTGPS